MILALSPSTFFGWFLTGVAIGMGWALGALLLERLGEFIGGLAAKRR